MLIEFWMTKVITNLIQIDLMTKRKRQLLTELKRLEAKERVKQFNHMPTDLS